MNTPKNWVVVGTAAVLGVGGGLLTASLGLNDRASDDDARSVLLQTETIEQVATADLSPESADSPNESARDSADSASDSPGDPGYVDRSLESADLPADSSADSPVAPIVIHEVSAASADSPVPARQPATTVRSVASADSPAAPRISTSGGQSSDDSSPASAASADSPD